MKKLILILIPFIFLSCNNSFWTGEQKFTFSNKTNRDIIINYPNNDNIHVAADQTKIVYAYADTNFSINNCYRCALNFQSHGNYLIEESNYKTITVFNNSSYTIILSEENNYIGSYSELIALANSENKPISDVKIKIEINPGSSQTFKLYTTTNPKYSAYFKNNNMTADLSLLSFSN